MGKRYKKKIFHFKMTDILKEAHSTQYEIICTHGQKKLTSLTIWNVGEDKEQLELTHWNKNERWMDKPLWKTIFHYIVKLNMYPSYDSVISPLNVWLIKSCKGHLKECLWQHSL